MESDASKYQNTSRPSNTLILLIILFLVVVGTIWFIASRQGSDETKYAFAINHTFEDPVVFYAGEGLKYEITPFDQRLLKVYIPPKHDLSKPRYLLVEDGELDFLGFVKKDQTFIPLTLFQIHNDRPGKPSSPVTDCKTYLQVPNAVADTVLVLIDRKYILRGAKAGPNMYVINFCETTREHEFQLLGPYGGDLAMKSPSAFGFGGSGGPQSFWYRVTGSGDTLRYGQNPALYSALGTTPTTKPAMYGSESGTGSTSTKKSAMTKVIFSLPRSLERPWVYLNGKRLTKYTLSAARNQITFWVKQKGQEVKVRVGDANCECQGQGRAYNPVLELAGYCECRDIQVFVNLDKGLDRFRNKIRIYIDGQLTDMRVPPAGQPIVLSIRKTDRDRYVEMKLQLPDDTGSSGLFDLCNFTIPTETTTVNLSPSCLCQDCPPNIKVSGNP